MNPARVTIRIPGSTSNCGAGFDTLGLALNLYNRITLTQVAGSALQPADASDQAAHTMVAAAADIFFRCTRRDPFGFRYSITGDVPPARGLGSSVTVRAGILAGLNELSGVNATRHELVAMATELEGHPDNASAGILGGFCVSRCDPATGAYIDTIKIDVAADLAFVVASPRLQMLTKESRGVLPAQLPYFDAVKSINSATYLVAAFATRDYARLREAVADFMHEPYRLPHIPGGKEAIASGIGAGALTGWLSGSGSSVLCVCLRAEAERVKQAMQRAFEIEGVFGGAHILSADNHGLVVE